MGVLILNSEAFEPQHGLPLPLALEALFDTGKPPRWSDWHQESIALMSSILQIIQNSEVRR